MQGFFFAAPASASAETEPRASDTWDARGGRGTRDTCATLDGARPQPMPCAPREPQVALLCSSRWVEASVRDALQADGVAVSPCTSVQMLIGLLRGSAIDLLVVEDSGVHLASCMTALRFRGAATVPVLAVGGGSAQEIAQALRYGACDYAVLGESLQPLVNRVRARATLARERSAAVELQVGCCFLDEPSRTLRHPGGQLQLTFREFALAWVLFEHAGQVVHLQTLSQQVWGRDSSVAKRTIEQHVSRLRAKLAAACAGAQELLSLQAIHNVGYRMVVKPRPQQEAPAA